MNCRQAERVLDGGRELASRADADALEVHLVQCETCRKWAAELEGAYAELAGLGAVAPLAPAVREQVVAAVPPPTHGGSLWRMAAVFLLGIGVGAFAVYASRGAPPVPAPIETPVATPPSDRPGTTQTGPPFVVADSPYADSPYYVDRDANSFPTLSEFLWYSEHLPVTTGDRYFATNHEGVVFYTSEQAFEFNTARATIPAGVQPVGR